MKSHLLRLIVLAIICTVCASAAPAQDERKVPSSAANESGSQPHAQLSPADAELRAAKAESHEVTKSSPRCVVDYAPQTPDEAELVRIERDWCDAAIDRDAKKLDRIFADDISWVEDAGYRNKAQVMHRFMVEVQEHVIELRDMRIRMFGKIAVVSSHVHVKKTTDGKLTESDHTATDVFEKRAGRWQLVVE